MISDEVQMSLPVAIGVALIGGAVAIGTAGERLANGLMSCA
jgi:hypothetical protein